MTVLIRMSRLLSDDAEDSELFYILALTASQFIDDSRVAEHWLSKILEVTYLSLILV